MDRQHPLIAFASRWHACTGDVPPPLVGASITFVEVPDPASSSHRTVRPAATATSSSSTDAQGSNSAALPAGATSSTPGFTGVTSKSRIYVFGGRLVSTRRMISDLWHLDLDTLVWTKVTPRASVPLPGQPVPKHTPSPRYFHSADVWNDKLIIFGGMGYQAAGTARTEQLVTDSVSAADNGGSSSGGTGAGAGGKNPTEQLCVLDDILTFDLITNEWNFSFVPKDRQASSTQFRPAARYAHLSAISSEFLIVLGGQNAANGYIERIDVFHLPSRTWAGHQVFEKQCGSYRSLVASPQFMVSTGCKAPIEDAQMALRMGSSATGAPSSLAFAQNRAQSRASDAATSPSVASMDASSYDRNGDRNRSDSTASRPSLLSMSSFSGNAPSSTDTSTLRSAPSESGTKHGMGPGAGTGLSALVGNPAHASTANLSLFSHTGSSIVGSSQLESEDGASTTGADFAMGVARDASNYAEEMDRPALPTYPLPMSLPASQARITRSTRAGPISRPAAEDETIADASKPAVPWPAPPLYLYSNYHFTDVKREIEVVSLEMRQREGSGANRAKVASDSIDLSNTDVSLKFQEISSAMRGAMLPPGLRFPTGTVVGEHLIVSGTYLANTSQSFSIWSLHLPTLVWTRIDVGNILSTGSWNRAVVWPGNSSDAMHRKYAKSAPKRAAGSSHDRDQEHSSGSTSSAPKEGGFAVGSAGADLLGQDTLHDETTLIRPPFKGNKLVILGHRGRDLVNDYNHRQVNCDHVIIVDLESWGIYQPPASAFSASNGIGSSADAGPSLDTFRTATGTAMAVELGLAKLRSSAQGGLVPVSFLSSNVGDSGSPASVPKDNQQLRSVFGPSVTRLRSDSSATASSADSGSSRSQRRAATPAEPAVPEDAANQEPTEQLLPGPESTASSATHEDLVSPPPQQRMVAPLPFAPLSFGGRGDFEIICSDGLWIGCDRVVLERRWPWFAERMKEYRKRAKRFAAANASGQSQPAALSAQATGGQADNLAASKSRLDATVGVVGNSQPQSTEASDATQDSARSGTALLEEGKKLANGAVVPALGREDENAKETGLSVASPSIRRSPDPRMTPRQLVFPEPSPVVLALLEFLYTRTICTALQRHPVVLASLLVLGTTYQLHDLVQWCVHAAHVVITSDLSPPSSDARLTSRNATPTSTSLAAFAAKSAFADGSIYAGSALNTYDPVRNELSIEQRHRYAVLLFEAATLCGSEALQIRALRTVMSLNKYEVGRQHLEQRKKTHAASPSGAGVMEHHDGYDNLGRPEHGRTRASTTASGYPNQKPVLSLTSPAAQTPYQHLMGEARGSLDEGNEATATSASYGTGRSGFVSSGQASGVGSGPTRPRATTNPSKNDGLMGRTSLSGSGGQYRNGIVPSASQPQSQSQLQTVTQGMPPSAAGPALTAGSASSTGSSLLSNNSRLPGGKKRFSLFGRTMGSSSGVGGSGTGGGGPASTSPIPSPSTSNVDVSTLGMGAGTQTQEHQHQQQQMMGAVEQIGSFRLEHQANASMVPRPSEDVYGGGQNGGLGPHPQQMGRTVSDGLPPASSSSRLAQTILTRVGGQTSAGSIPSPSSEQPPISPPRMSSQTRVGRGLSSATRAPRVSGGGGGGPGSNSGAGGGSTSGGSGPGSAVGTSGQRDETAGGGRKSGSSSADVANAPPSGLVARLVREREASGGPP
ncbi:hypothetical protein OC835_003225 [Tilletia horrida]|nr:hypothetical protein OC835_003225 [Tilletia horrida]